MSKMVDVNLVNFWSTPCSGPRSGPPRYREALNNEIKKRKRGQPFTEEIRAEEGFSVLFFSPSKVQKARELQDTKEAAKEREAL